MESPVVTVREARLGDLEALLRWYAQLNLPGEPPATPERPTEAHQRALATILARDDVWLLIAERAGVGVGTVQLTIVPNLTHGGRPWANVENVVVDEHARGLGVGSALLDEAVGRAQAAGCYKISLTSRVEREAAHRFYEARGFQARHRGYSRYFPDVERSPREQGW
ncbi:MAG TPA: GNAT family N-acetyltransferase [Dehalococcoidia bacterium]|nr:GNAT family N-acetyltransferase [Dehalococcoidia bacterium]